MPASVRAEIKMSSMEWWGLSAYGHINAVGCLAMLIGSSITGFARGVATTLR